MTLAALRAFPIEDLTEPGTWRPWGEIAHRFQVADVEAFLDDEGPWWHWWSRPRGASKTQDAALLVLALLVTVQPPWTTTHLYARDADQAAIVFDKLRAVVGAVPDLAVTGAQIENTRTGARIVVEPADSSSVLGLTPWLIVVDEVLGWPVTREHVSLWGNILSGAGKRRDARVLVISSAGDPATPYFKAFETAKAHPGDWRVSHLPGPSPLASAESVERARRNLPESLFAWHYLNEPAAPDNALATSPEVEAVFAGAPTRRQFDPGQRYLVTADLSETNDWTVLLVSHMETGDVLVVDALVIWKPSRARPIKYAAVKAALVALSDEYGRAPVVMDKSRGEQLAQELTEAGRQVRPVPFTVEYNTQLALSLQQLLRSNGVRGLASADFRDELATVYVLAGGSGRLRIEHHSGRHNDVTITLAMAAHYWLKQPFRGKRSFTTNLEGLAAAPAVVRDRSSLPIGVARGRVNRQRHARQTLARLIRGR